MRRFADSLGQVLGAIWAHKLRSFLTMFGIAWGVGSLLLLVGLGEGFREGTKKNLATFGEDYMQIFNGRVPAIGRASCRERVSISVVAVSLKKKKKRSQKSPYHTKKKKKNIKKTEANQKEI